MLLILLIFSEITLFKGTLFRNLRIHSLASSFYRLLKMGNSSSSSDNASTSSTSPWFTHGLESPPFETTEVKEGYEIRKYKASKWVGTQVKAMSCKEALVTGFRRLFKYISGQNATHQKIPMTAPVTAKVEPSQGPACETNFIIHFYIPKAFQINSPAPTNSEVSFYEYPEFTAYTLSYSGFTSDEKLLQHASQLGTLLERDGVDFVKDYYFYCGYDPPYRLFNRHNEVWFVAKSNTESSK